MRSNPASRTMVATIIDDMFKRPEFAGINAPPSTKGEGGQALARGEGDMAIQTISQILPYKEIELVGPVPKEFGLWIDTMLAVSSRATHPDDAKALIRYLLRPESNKVWKPRGMERFVIRRGHDCETCPRHDDSLGGGALGGPGGQCAIGSLCRHLDAERCEEQYSPGPVPKSITSTYEAAGQGYKVSVTNKSASGNVSMAIRAASTGKTSTVTGNNPNADTLAVRRIDARTLETVSKKGGKVTITQRNVLSADGKTRTVTTTGIDATGQKVNNVAVFERR